MIWSARFGECAINQICDKESINALCPNNDNNKKTNKIISIRLESSVVARADELHTHIIIIFIDIECSVSCFSSLFLCCRCCRCWYCLSSRIPRTIPPALSLTLYLSSRVNSFRFGFIGDAVGVSHVLFALSAQILFVSLYFLPFFICCR